MKFTAEDFANRLAGGMDKHTAVDTIKAELTKRGYKCKIVRRQTATGKKIYFVIEPYGEQSFCNPWWKDSESIIRAHFPDCRLTSGGSTGWTIAEYT